MIASGFWEKNGGWLSPAAAGAASSALFLGFRYGLVFPGDLPGGRTVFELALAVAAYVGMTLLLPRPVGLRRQLAEMAAAARMDEAEVASLIGSSRGKVERIRKINEEISGRAHDRIEAVATIASRIVEGFRDDPSDIRRSRNFLYHYLDATVDIVEQYRELNRKSAGERVRQVLDKSEQTLAEIETVFQRQYQRNLDDEALALDVDLDVLRRMMKGEGL